MDLDLGPRGESLMRSLLPASPERVVVGVGRMQRPDKYLQGEEPLGLRMDWGGGYEWGGGVLSDLRFLAWGTGQMMDAEGKVDDGESNIY